MNREQYRRWAKTNKKHFTDTCPYCKRDTRFVFAEDVPGEVTVKCAVCDAVVNTEPELKEFGVKGVYMPFPLRTLEAIILSARMQKQKEQEQKEKMLKDEISDSARVS